MIGISRHTDYASRLVLHLACLGPGAKVPLREVAEARLLPAPYVRRLVGRLVKAGILATERGSAGGVRLARPASEITLLDVVQAMEGRLALNECVGDHAACPFAGTCPVQCAWTGATRALADHLAGIRFDTLAGGSPGHESSHRKPSRSHTA